LWDEALDLCNQFRHDGHQTFAAKCNSAVPELAQLLHYLLIINPGLQSLLPLLHIAHYEPFPTQPYLPAMIAQDKGRITATVTGGLAKLIQDLLFHFLTALR
jgi:hypothetical protein